MNFRVPSGEVLVFFLTSVSGQDRPKNFWTYNAGEEVKALVWRNGRRLASGESIEVTRGNSWKDYQQFVVTNVNGTAQTVQRVVIQPMTRLQARQARRERRKGRG